MRKRHGCRLVIGVVSGMTGQYRINRAVLSEGERSGIPGGGYLMFVGNVSKHGRTYKEGRGIWLEMRKLSKFTNGVYTHASVGYRILAADATSRH